MDFERYFDVRDLAFDAWNPINGLEVMPLFSLHPVETSVLFFRALWEGGYKPYAHLAEIASFDVLKRMLTEDPAKSGIDRELFEAYVAALKRPVDLKKIDVGGGPIHGKALDFAGDTSKRIILSHLSVPLTDAEKEIGSSASFGQDDVLIATHCITACWSRASTCARNFPACRNTTSPCSQIVPSWRSTQGASCCARGRRSGTSSSS